MSMRIDAAGRFSGHLDGLNAVFSGINNKPGLFKKDLGRGEIHRVIINE